MSDRSEPVARNGVASDLNLVTIAAKSAVESAVQRPLEGVAQLVGMKAPKLIDSQPAYEFNSPEWYASTIGHGAGFMLPFLATSKVTGMFVKEAGIGKAMIDGAASGFVFTPTAESQNGLAVRTRDAFTSGMMFGAQHALTEALSGFAIKSAPTISRLGINAISGTAGGLASLEATSLLTGNGFVTDKQTLIENAVSSAVTGFALDAARLVKLPNRPTSDPTAIERAGLTEVLLRASTPVERVGNESARRHQAVQIPTGKDFQMTSDGRIFYTEKIGDAVREHVWTPFGSHKGVTAYISEKPGDFGHTIWQRHEPQGFYTRRGQLDVNELHNLYANEKSQKQAPELTVELDQKLSSRLPARLEPDDLAQARILPMPDGKAYEPSTMSITTQRPGEIPKGISAIDYNNNWLQTKQVQSRRYLILSAEGAMDLAQMRIQNHNPNEIFESLKSKAIPVVVPETYAQQLDTIRDIRKLATQYPPESTNPQQVLEARKQLFQSPLRDRYLPEHWGQFFDTLPNPRLINHVELLPAQSHNNYIAEAEFQTRTIRFFGDHNSVHEHVRRTLLHEWSHLAEKSQPTLRNAFGAAADVTTYFGRDYATKNTHENWAVHFGEMLMDPNPELFMTFADHSPLRTVLLAETLKREIAKAPESFHNAPEMQSRLAYVDEHILPRAKTYMNETLIASNDLKHVKAGVQLLERLGTTSEDIAFRRKLFDVRALKDDAVSALWNVRFGTEWKPESAARGLLRLELYSTLDQKGYQEIMRFDGNRIQAKLVASTSADLNSGDAARIKNAVNLIQQLSGTPLADRLTIPEDFLAAYQKTQDASVAEQLFGLYESTERRSVVRGLAKDMLNQEGLNRQLAAKFFIGDTDGKALWEAVDTLRNQIKANDFTAFSKPVITELNNRLDQYTMDFIEGRQEPKTDIAHRTYARARLFEAITAAKPELMQDPLMQLRMQRVEAFYNVTKDPQPAATTGTADGAVPTTSGAASAW